MNDAVKLPAVTAASPAMSFDAMQRLAESIAKSGLFGIKTADQALTLMSIAQAEGRHPALAARDYHIIQGAPAKKAEAMLRDFLSAGGRVEWHELSDAAAEATFSHPAGGSVRLRWDQARVLQAQLASNPMHKKYPRQMLRSRVISEGVRTVWPMATSGMYVPEEVAEFAPARHAEVIDVTPRADLDAFANGVGMPTDDSLRITAEQTAMDGTAAFREWWKTLDAGQRNALRPDLAEYQRVAAEADEARVASEARAAVMPSVEEDPFGLPPLPTTEQPPQEAPSAEPWPGPSDEENLVVPLPLPRRRTDADLEYYARQLLAMIAEKPLTTQRAAWIKDKNEAGIGYLKLKLVERYDEVMAKLNAKVEAA